MKRKREEKRKQQQAQKKPNYSLTVILAALIPTCLFTGAVYRIPARFIAPPVVILLWIVASLFVWQRANARAYGDEWWQDHR
jgi:undecaprenyl pyrophosphate phosphatase UppP